MRIHVLSDLHLEFHPFEVHPFATTDAPDVVVLAGDIWTGYSGIDWARRKFPDCEIVYVLGNHEYYGWCVEDLERRARDIADRLGVHLLQNQAVTIGAHRILGCTLWTDFALFGPGSEEESMRCVKHALADYRRIHRRRPLGEPPSLLTVEDTLQFHNRSREWLKSEVVGADVSTVVVTHHYPSVRSMADRYMHDPVSAGFGSDLDDLLGRCGLWIHGHTHDSFDYVVRHVGGVPTRVVSNPRGYPRGSEFENPTFRADLQVAFAGGSWEIA